MGKKKSNYNIKNQILFLCVDCSVKGLWDKPSVSHPLQHLSCYCLLRTLVLEVSKENILIHSTTLMRETLIEFCCMSDTEVATGNEDKCLQDPIIKFLP